uniref:Uncharacterized protein n=1 Tax=Arundo donax TaxID=35708 RepID=A0A0A9DDU1_ARUDO
MHAYDSSGFHQHHSFRRRRCPPPPPGESPAHLSSITSSPSSVGQLSQRRYVTLFVIFFKKNLVLTRLGAKCSKICSVSTENTITPLGSINAFVNIILGVKMPSATMYPCTSSLAAAAV